MQNSGEVLYGVNELVIALVVVGLLLLTIELGYRLGDKIPSGDPNSAKSPVLAISGAIFGLLALLLRFTFSMSLSRFEQRKELVSFSMGHAIDHTAFLYHYCRLGAEVLLAAEEEIDIATEQGFQLWHALGTLHMGAAKLLQSRRDEALPFLLEGLEAFRATGAQVRVPAYLCILGDVYAQCGRFEEAHNVLDEGLTVAEKNGDRCHEAELHRVKRELLLAESPNQSALAEDCFHRASRLHNGS